MHSKQGNLFSYVDIFVDYKGLFFTVNTTLKLQEI